MLFHIGRNQLPHRHNDTVFLWPEHNYEGEVTRSQPPTRTFRAQMASKALPWTERLAYLRYRGTPGHPVRRAVLGCRNKSRPELREFYDSRTDISAIDWPSTQQNANKSRAAHGMDRFLDFRSL